MKIPVCKPLLPIGKDLLPYIDIIDSTRQYSNNGKLVQLLENKIAKHYGLSSSCVACVSSATMGLMLALKALDVPSNKTCVIPSWTFSATAHAVLAAGLNLRVVDVDENSGALTPQLIENQTESQFNELGAVIVVSHFGAPIDGKKWDEWSIKWDKKVVIDAAAGFDSLVPSNVPAVVSLHATKPLSSGEGGFVICRDEDLVKRIKSIRNFGFEGGNSSLWVGFNGKLSEYHAAVGNASFDCWKETRRTFQSIHGFYSEELELNGRNWVSSTVVVSIESDIDLVQEKLSGLGIASRKWWGSGLHTQPAFSEYCKGNYPATDKLSKSLLGLPCYVDLETTSIRHISQSLRSILSTTQ